MAATGLTIRGGIDIVYLPRLERLIAAEGEAFLAAVWTREERHDADGRVDRLGARWAAKEAALKALGMGVEAIPLRDVAVAVSPGGDPRLVLTGTAQREARDQGWREWSVSLSHDGEYAVAQVVALVEPGILGEPGATGSAGVIRRRGRRRSFRTPASGRRDGFLSG